jgi:cytochrome c-type biogenesis protein
MTGIYSTVVDGSLLLAIPLAFAAGLVSFLSPCVLPLAPGYLSYVTGLTGAEIAGEPGSGVRTAVRSRVLLGSVLFVLGFSLVFVSFGAFFGGLGAVLLEYADVISRVLGVVVIALGLGFMGAFDRWMPGMQREWRIHRMPTYGVWGAPFLGVLFGLGWTPCIGPTLTAVQSLAFTEASAARGALLAFIYCLGLGLPFIALGLAFRQLAGTLAWVRRHYTVIMRIGGGLLVLIGLLLVTGVWTQFTIWMRVWLPGFETVL